jgi:23S rRNA (pseudouridine1915-N3)-methyltransferase
LRLEVLCIGKLKAGPEKALADEYQVRLEGLGRKVGIAKLTVHDFPESQAQTPARRMADEARLLATKASTIVLDERGNSLSSGDFAKLLQRHLDHGTQDLAFLVGGPDGHAPQTRQTAGEVLSFGPMTWPHRLVRVMLFEQIYRAVTILVNHPYHRP